jgi:cytochrome c-type protein NapC
MTQVTHDPKDPKRGWRTRTRQVLFAPSARFSLITLVVGGAVLGAVLVLAIPAVVDATSTNAFCVSCHEMTTPQREYLESSHGANKSGVIAACADCHIPHRYPDKLVLKTLSGARDVYGHLMGLIDTPEKFEARRAQMAQREQKRMKANDSAECRHCHALNAAVIAKQTRAAVKEHEKALARKQTCIECHTGLVHEEPRASAAAKGDSG